VALLDQLITQEKIIFSGACGVVSLLAFIVDFMIYKTQGTQSRLGIVYKLANGFVLAFLWIIGASIVGYFSTMLGIFSPTPQSIITVGLSWPIIFIKIVNRSNQDAGTEEEEPVTEDEQ